MRRHGRLLLTVRVRQDGDHVMSYVRAPAIELTFDRRIKVNTDCQVLEGDRATYSLAGRARVLAPPLP